jgi:hypothetical protein
MLIWHKKFLYCIYTLLKSNCIYCFFQCRLGLKKGGGDKKGYYIHCLRYRYLTPGATQYYWDKKGPHIFLINYKYIGDDMFNVFAIQNIWSLI